MRNKYQLQIGDILHTTGIKPKQLLDLTFLFWKFNQVNQSSRIDSNAMVFLNIMKNNGVGLSDYFRESKFTEDVITRVLKRRLHHLLDTNVLFEYLLMLDENIYFNSMKFLSEIADREHSDGQSTIEVSRFIAWLLVKDIENNSSIFSFIAHNSTVLQCLIESGKVTNFICYESNFDSVIDRHIQFDFNDVLSFSVIDFPIYGIDNVNLPLNVDIAFSQFPWSIDLPKEEIENRFFRVSSFPDFAFLINLARTLSINGKAITLIHDSLFRLKKFKKDRQSLIESGYIESVVSLPSGSIVDYSGNPCLIILSRNNENINCYDFSKLGKWSEGKFKFEYQAGNEETYKVIDLKDIENFGYRIDFTELFYNKKEKNNVIQ